MSKIVVIHAGANKTKRYGGFRAPIFSDGSFIFMQFPEAEGRVHDPELPTYRSMGWEPYVPKELLARCIHLDPSFPESGIPSTYGHYRRPGDNIIFDLKDGAGYLFFMASLAYDASKGIERLPCINREWGVYLVGWFRVKRVLTQKEFMVASPEVRQEFKYNPHFTRRDAEQYAPLWISSIKASLLKTAVPLSDPDDPLQPNKFTKNVLRTVKGKRISDNTPFYHLVLKCEDNIQDFWRELRGKNPELFATDLQ